MKRDVYKVKIETFDESENIVIKEWFLDMNAISGFCVLRETHEESGLPKVSITYYSGEADVIVLEEHIMNYLYVEFKEKAKCLVK